MTMIGTRIKDKQNSVLLVDQNYYRRWPL